MDNTKIKLWAMTLITVLMCVNLLTLGYNGTVLAIVVGAIAGLAGYQVKSGKTDKILADFMSRIDHMIPLILMNIPVKYRAEVKKFLDSLKTEG